MLEQIKTWISLCFSCEHCVLQGTLGVTKLALTGKKSGDLNIFDPDLHQKKSLFSVKLSEPHLRSRSHQIMILNINHKFCISASCCKPLIHVYVYHSPSIMQQLFLFFIPHSNYTWRRVQVMKRLIMQFSATSCHFISLRSKYSPQHPQSMFLP
jgi:hypothetical protein